MESSRVWYYFPSEKKTIKRSAQCHVFAQSPPGRRPSDEYTVNTSRRSHLCAKVPLQCYSLATVIHTVSTQLDVYICNIYLYKYSSQYGSAGRAKRIVELRTAVNATCQGNFSACDFVHACQKFARTVLD